MELIKKTSSIVCSWLLEFLWSLGYRYTSETCKIISAFTLAQNFNITSSWNMYVIYLDFCKAFDIVPTNILISELASYGFDEWTVRWIRSWLDALFQYVAVKGSQSKGKLPGSIPQGSVLQPILFNIHISELGSGIECTFSTKLCGVVNVLEESDAIQSHLHRLERWVCANFKKFSKTRSCMWVGEIPNIHNFSNFCTDRAVNWLR